MSNSEAEGLQAIIRILRITEHAKEIELQRTRRELASVSGELAELKMWFAQALSQGEDVPEALTVRQLEKWKELK